MRNPLKQPCCSIFVVFLFSAFALSTKGQTEPNALGRTSEPDAIAYKVARTIRSDDEKPGPRLYLFISVAPDSFVREKMAKLAHQLSEDFAKESRLYVAILDSETVAQNYRPYGGSYAVSMKLLRGEYFLDRQRGEDYLHFSTKRGNPVSEVTINLGRQVPREAKRIPRKRRKTRR